MLVKTKEEIKKSDLYKRCKRVVESCTNMDQIYVAREYCRLAVEKMLRNDENIISYINIYSCFITDLEKNELGVSGPIQKIN